MSEVKKAASLSSPTVSHDEHAKQLERPTRQGSSSSSKHVYEEHGPGIDHKIPQEEAVQSEPGLWWSRTRHFLREPLSEFFGVFILILFGDGQVLSTRSAFRSSYHTYIHLEYR